MEIETGLNGEPVVLLVQRSVPPLDIAAQSRALKQTLIQRFASAAESVQELRPAPATGSTAAGVVVSDPGAALEPAQDDRDASSEAGEVLSVLGVGLQLPVQGLKGLQPGSLRDSLLQLLPHLFKLQELAGPVLQKLAAESQLALVLLKYLPLDPSHISSVLTAIHQAVGSPVWSSRASALLFTQYFWFRQCFLLNQEHLQVLKDVVLSRMSDVKPEVRAIAMATLAGMIKGLPAPDVDQLRAQVLSQARQLLVPSGRRTRGGKPKEGDGTAATATADTLMKQAAVLGLKAFLMSSPYDCPAWMPEVLMALVPAAGTWQAAAVRSEASVALSEFKRTHEQDSMDALKAVMGPDDWESLQAVTSSASYFA